MGTSPLSPEEIRAAAGAHHQLGPEYSDAVVASFLDKVDSEIAARVEARLAGISEPRRQRRFTLQALAGRDSRHALVKGIAIGLCAGGALALARGPAIALASIASAISWRCPQKRRQGRLRCCRMPESKNRGWRRPEARG